MYPVVLLLRLACYFFAVYMLDISFSGTAANLLYFLGGGIGLAALITWVTIVKLDAGQYENTVPEIVFAVLEAILIVVGPPVVTMTINPIAGLLWFALAFASICKVLSGSWSNA